MPVEVLDKMMPGGLGKEIGEMFAYAAEFGYDGGDPSVVHPKDVSPFFLSVNVNFVVR